MYAVLIGANENLSFFFFFLIWVSNGNNHYLSYGRNATDALLISSLGFSECNSYSLYHFKWLIKEEWLFIFQHVHMC